MKQSERYNISHPDLCHGLRWKGQFTASEEDRTVPSTRDHIYWCVFTQTTVGPDGQLAEPIPCSVRERSCYHEAKLRLGK